ncbi:MAG: cob(I)yrinic acid a,c-diamide adenosyltransferase [Chloroflexota bacterium]
MDEKKNIPPSMRAYGRQLFICQNGTCAPTETAVSLNATIRPQLGALRRLRNPERVKNTLSECLGVCSGGPIVVVYPDGVWYHHVTDEVMTRIINEHLIEGNPVEEYIFHRLYPAGQEPTYAPAQRGDEGSYDPESNSTLAPSTNIETTELTGEERRKAARKKRLKKGLTIVNTGEGKGKTTAALGIMTRAWGRNMRVGLIQFLKNERARFGEIRAAERMNIERIGLGDGWTWTSKDMDETEARAVAGWELAQTHILSGDYDVLILDEFTYPLHYGWLDETAVLDWLQNNKPEMLHLIITGRYASQALIKQADLVTEMRNIKHPLETQGIRAQKGIEF